MPSAQNVRDAATARLAQARPDITRLSPEELLYELQVHQIELEMQNDSLREALQAQEVLEAARDRYVTLYEFAPVGYLTLSRAGLITDINGTGAAFLGEEKSTLLNRRFDHYVVESDRDDWEQFFIHVWTQKGPRCCNLALQRTDGRDLPVQVDSQPGENQHVYVTLTDITVLKTAKLHLMQARDAAEQGSRTKSAFLANMSHEIRTPMNAILGMAYLLERDGVTTAQAEKLAIIGGAAKHLLGIINDILDISKIESGSFLLEDTEVALDAILANVNSILSPQLNAKGLRLVLESDKAVPSMRGDVTRLTQALLNYANNAVKFTEKGSVIIRTHLLEESNEHVLVRFEVEDTGIGIEHQHMARLFTAFEQANNSTTRKFGGTGLGLAITKRLAQLMDGDAGASSTPSIGSLFWFTARLRKSVAAPVGPAPLDATPAEILARDYPGQRALLVEDDPVNQTIALELLRDVGLEVVVANNGEEALAHVAQSSFDLILLDVQMPKMDGLEAARRIRRLSGWETVPIVAITANAFLEDREACLLAGMNDHVVKPILPNILYANVLAWLGRQRLTTLS